MRYRSRPSTPRYGTWLAGFLALATPSVLTATLSLLAAMPDTAAAQRKQLQATFSATTTGMTPADLGLRIQILGWSDEAGRSDVLATLDDSAALARLPTVGYLWPAGSPVGYTIKYAHRTPEQSGGERITLITDKALGSYDFKKWSVAGSAPPSDRKYSVVELYVDDNGQGVGSFSLAGDVVVDTEAGTVALGPGGARLLTNVKRESST
jgi:hypothetical protein